MKFKKSSLIVFIIIVSALVSITSAFSLGLGGLHTGIIRFALVFGIMLLLIKNIHKDITTILIIATLVYLFISLMTNTYPLNSINQYLGLFISLFMYPFAYKYIYKAEHYDLIRKSIIALLYIYFFHFLFAQIFQIGDSPYLIYGGTYLGGGYVYQTYVLAYFLLILPFLYMHVNRNLKFHEKLAIVLSLIPLILIFRRAAVIGVVVGVLIYFYYTSKKGRSIKYLIVFGILLILSSPIYLDTFYNLLEVRTISPEDVADTSRGREFSIALNLIKQRGLGQLLFGVELFDYRTFANVTRPLHVDFMRLLVGSGLIGFTLYFSVFVSIWVRFYRKCKRINSRKIRNELKAVMGGLIFLFLILSYSSQVTQISSLTIIIIFLAMLLRYVDIKINEQRLKKERVN